jgi:hypothetical protein
MGHNILSSKFAENRNLRSGFFLSSYDTQIGFKEAECERVWRSKCEIARFNKGSNEGSYSIKSCVFAKLSGINWGVVCHKLHK